MNIEIIIKKREIRVILAEGKEKLDEIIFPEDYNLSQKLLPAVDKILSRNGLKITDIKKTRLISDIKEPYTSYRIAKAVVSGLNLEK